jgi:hypothetical protein
MADADQVVIGADGRVCVAPVGTALPEDIAASLNVAFVDVGYVSEEGVNFADTKEVEGIPAWQSLYDIRKVVSSKETKVEFAMRQWNGENVPFAFGGGQVLTAGGVYIYQPAVPGEMDYRSLVIEWEDGSKNYRLVVPRGMAVGEVSSQLTRTSAADLPISFEAMPDGIPDASDNDTQPWYLVTDDPSFA